QKYAIVLRESSEIRIEGVRIVNSPLWTLRLQDCDQVWIRGVYIYSDLEKGVNADGIDIVSTSNVSISASTIMSNENTATCAACGIFSAGLTYPRRVRSSSRLWMSSLLFDIFSPGS